ncbi:MAG: C40 family peptidase [Bacteroidia bacterium]|nr:C40 family peptidase [Bacteroidia bacterium]
MPKIVKSSSNFIGMRHKNWILCLAVSWVATNLFSQENLSYDHLAFSATVAKDSTAQHLYPDVLPLKADLIQITNEWKGTRYRYGGMSKQGTDCSGFVLRVLEQAMPQVQLPRSSKDMYAQTLRIPLCEAKPGDLLFFRNSVRLPISHVGIYLGQGYFAHAVGYHGVIISHLSEDYHKKTFYAATRITEKNFKKDIPH